MTGKNGLVKLPTYSECSKLVSVRLDRIAVGVASGVHCTQKHMSTLMHRNGVNVGRKSQRIALEALCGVLHLERVYQHTMRRREPMIDSEYIIVKDKTRLVRQPSALLHLPA